MDLKHLKALDTIKEGISIEVLNDLNENREKYSGLLESIEKESKKHQMVNDYNF